jgi:signal transduction histidine kinase
VDNALDALRGESAPHLTIRIGETLREYTFSVENDGPAIDPAFIGTLFEPGVTTHGEGRGMGLSIVKDIMDSYGGRVEVESDEARRAFPAFCPRRRRCKNAAAGGRSSPGCRFLRAVRRVRYWGPASCWRFWRSCRRRAAALFPR